MLSSLFDEYSLNARVRPALLALLPIAAFVYLIFPQLYEVLIGALSLCVIFGLVTVLAHLCRSAGKKAEKRLFKDWGGRPSTIILRHRDDYLDMATKERYHKYLAKNIDGWLAPTLEEELRNPTLADNSYNSAVRWLLERTRNQKHYSLLFKENINYGFRRNCYGIKWLALALTALPIASILGDVLIDSVSFININSPLTWVSLTLSILLFFWWLFVVTEPWVKDAARRYATRLLAACENNTH